VTRAFCLARGKLAPGPGRAVGRGIESGKATASEPAGSGPPADREMLAHGEVLVAEGCFARRKCAHDVPWVPGASPRWFDGTMLWPLLSVILGGKDCCARA